MDYHKEGASVLITAVFTDDAGAAVVPSSAKYQVDDQSGTNIVPLTVIPGTLASSMEFEIPPLKNQMVEATNTVETRTVTVRFVYGAARQGANQYLYGVKNLKGTLL